MRQGISYAALLLVTLLAAPAGAQQNPADIEVKGGDVLRTCREVHRAAQAQEPDAVATPQGITFNCRLVNANGSTLAQVSPEEVCERLTGSREWYRGAGTQVFCAADGVKTRAVAVPCPQPTDEQIVAEDVSRACQKVHRAGNASAEPLRMSVNGPEFNCRLSNSAGFTIAGVSPEQVCEVKTGREQWCFTETTSYCRGVGYVEPVNPFPGRDQELIPNPKPRPKPGGDESNVEIPPDEEIEFCKPKVPGGEVVVRVTRKGETRKGYQAIPHPLVTCGSGPGMLPEKLCPTITGSADWYLSAKGFFKTKDGIMWPDWIAVCRGSGPRERIAFADVTVVCVANGWQYGNSLGFHKDAEGFCYSDKLVNHQPIAVTKVCSELYGTTPWKRIGATAWCLP